MQSVTVRVPATTANLGPGYDCLGVALQIYNQVTVTRDSSSPEHPMADEARTAFFETAGVDPFPIAWTIEGDVPRARGLGSSVTVRLGLLHGLNHLAGKPLARQEIFTLCSQLEGHPDNAAPAEFGGFTVADGVNVTRFPVDDALHFVLLIPSFEVATKDARAVLPESLPLVEAVTSAAGACRITAAFASRCYASLKGAFEDYFHQPHRARLIPFLSDVIAAGEKAGALGGFLSGSGSTIACVTLDNPGSVAAAMLEAADDANAITTITRADNDGTQIRS